MKTSCFGPVGVGLLMVSAWAAGCGSGELEPAELDMSLAAQASRKGFGVCQAPASGGFFPGCMTGEGRCREYVGKDPAEYRKFVSACEAHGESVLGKGCPKLDYVASCSDPGGSPGALLLHYYLSARVSLDSIKDHCLSISYATEPCTRKEMR